MPITNSRSSVRNNAYAIRRYVSCSENFHQLFLPRNVMPQSNDTHRLAGCLSSGFFHTPTSLLNCFCMICLSETIWTDKFTFFLIIIIWNSIFIYLWASTSFFLVSFMKCLMASKKFVFGVLNWIFHDFFFSFAFLLLFRDNLITSSSQPVPKPNFVTAAKYMADHTTVSWLLMIVIHLLWNINHEWQCNWKFLEQWIAVLLCSKRQPKDFAVGCFALERTLERIHDYLP